MTRLSLRPEPLEAREVPAVIAVGASPGQSPTVTLFDPATGDVVGRVRAYEETVVGGVHTAVADLTGDGVPDLLTGPGVGGGPVVKAFDGVTREQLFAFAAYEPSFRGGVTVAAGDLTGDGVPEIVVGAGVGGGPRVRTFALTADRTGVDRQPLADFFTYEDSFRGGVNVAVGDVDGNGPGELVLGAGVGGAPRVRVLSADGSRELMNAFVFESSFRDGVTVAAGDVDGDGRAELVAGAGAGGGPRVRAMRADGSNVADFFAFDPALRTGLTVGTTDADADGRAELLAGIPAAVRRFAADGTMLTELALTTADPPAAPAELSAADVDTLLQRAAAASASSDAIIAVTDRNGRLLGLRTEGGVAAEVVNDPARLAFAADGAISLARTGAFFGNDQAPITSRTVRFISQTTVTEREVDSNPNIPDPDSTDRGPGFVAPVGIAGRFPPGVPFTPQVDLFGIEHTNRDGSSAPGADGIKGTADDEPVTGRFNADPRFVPAGQGLVAPDSYGVLTGTVPGGQNRGIATLPGGIPIFKDGRVVGGLGVFFPGPTGYATAANSAESTTYDPAKADRAIEAEWIAFAALGGAGSAAVGELDGVPLPAGIVGLPLGRIDLVGITLEVYGPGNPFEGVNVLAGVGAAVGRGSAADGVNRPVGGDGTTLRGGLPVPEGWLVLPHDGDGVTAAEAERIVTEGIRQAEDTRAAIRLPAGSRTRMAFAVADRRGEVVALYRMPDATVFSLDVAVAKARNAAYYADAAALNPTDQAPGVPAGTAFTARTFRYLALPRFPEGIDDSGQVGPFSQLADGGADPVTGRQVGPRLPASAYRSVFGYDAFNPGTNFRDAADPANRNGVVFFPGSSPLYRGDALVGGLGVSGDGVDQDDVVTAAAGDAFAPPPGVTRADQVFVGGVRLPYQKFNRNPEG